MGQSTINTTVALKKSEKRKIMELQEEYGFCTSNLVFHIAHYAADSLLKKKQIQAIQSPKSTIIRYALDLYRPFSIRMDTSEAFGLGYSCDFTYDALKDNLKQAGILEPCLFFAAIVRAIIEFPYDASRIKMRGVYTKKKASIAVVKRLQNRKYYTTLNLPVEVYGQFKAIAQKSNSSMNRMVIDALKSICNIEFNNRTFTENNKVFKKAILKPARIVEHNMHGKYGRLGIGISDIKLSVQVIAVIEKYGIPSAADLLKRIVYFIIAVHKGEIKLNNVQIEDNDDYNETRMVRDAYRKELTYGAH